MKRWVVAIVLGVVVAVGGYVVFSFSRPSLEKDFTLPDLDNHPIRLSSFAGHPLIVCFFSPRCGECKEEAPLLNELYEAHKREGLIIVGVGVGTRQAEEIREFAKENGIRYPVVADLNLSVAREFGVSWLPHLVFINRRGKIVSASAGKIPPEKLQEYLQAIL
jgi:peroxiredoxin